MFNIRNFFQYHFVRYQEMIMFGHSISTKRQFLFCLLMKCPNIITSAHFEPLVNCIHTHTHSHATDDFHGPNTVHKCHLLLVCFGYEVSHVGVNLSAFPGEIRFIIDHQLRIKTTTRHIRHTPIHTHTTRIIHNICAMCHLCYNCISVLECLTLGSLGLSTLGSP